MSKELIKEVLAQSSVAQFQSSALVIFFLFLLAVLVWVFWPGSKTYYETIASDVIKGE